MPTRILLLLCLGLLLPCSGARADDGGYFAPGTPNATALSAKVQAAAYDLLRERMLFDHDKLDRAMDMVKKADPDFFARPGLPARMGKAALSSKEVTKRGLTKEVKSLRAALRKEGHLSLLKDRRLRKALIYMERSGIFERFAKQNEETLTFCREMRRSAFCRACAAYQKVLWGAIEMTKLDGGTVADGPIDQAGFVKAGYLKSICTCPAKPAKGYLYHADTESISCPFHGTTEEATAKAAYRGENPGEAVKRMWEHNAVFKALDGEMKKVSPDGKGLVNVR